MRKCTMLTWATAFLLMLFSTTAFAQDKTVSGTVKDANTGLPLPGVSVKVSGSKTGTQTNASGSFSIKTAKGQTLEFSYVGYTIKRVAIKDANSINVSLEAESNDLENVEVVVAMDIKKKPRELPYSTGSVSGKDIAESQRENLINGLAGRVAGVTVNPTGGTAGASTSIVLRGFNSMALDNQPLFVVDGVIMDNQTVNETSNGGSQLGLASDRPNRNNDYTNRIADINPNDIENVTILKGPEATALYGSQASSGAIIITTKKGKVTGKVSINYDNAIRVSELNRLPNYSNKYGPGVNGVTNSSFQYFGPAYPANTNFFKNAENFFQTGIAQTHNLSAEYGKKNYTFRFSGSLFDQKGVVPSNNFKRYTLKITNTTKFGKYVDITPSIAYTRSVNDKPIRGAGGYLLNLLVWPTDNDVRDYLDMSGGKKTLYTTLGPNAELDNPFFNVNYNRSRDVNDRYTGTLGININPTKWLSISGRFGYDTYKTTGYTFYHPLSAFVTKGAGGSQDNYFRKYDGYNHTITATAKKKVGAFTGTVMVGNMWQNYRTQMYSVNGTNLVDSVNSAGQMVKNGVIITDPNFFSYDSSDTRFTTRTRLSRSRLAEGEYNYVDNRQVAFFGQFTLSYKNYIYLTYSHRFETSSIFPADYRNYNYPAGGLSVILSDMIPAIKTGGVVSYAKIRTSLANTARSSSPYANQSVLNPIFVSGGGFAYGFTNNNFFLEPERQKTYEIGTELKFFKNKFSFDVTYYNTKNDKQIVENFRSSYGTGYVLNTLNVGATKNEGIEISTDFTPIKTKKFSWNVRLNYNKMWNEVTSLPANVPEFYISDTWLYGAARGGLITGGPTTAITSAGYMRNNAGQILINPSNGLPVVDANFRVRGDRNPNYTMGIQNSLKYKNWSLNMLWDVRVGGDVFNGNEMYLTIQGKSRRTDDRETPRIVDGVLNDGLQNTATPTKNSIVINPYYNQAYYTTSMPEEEFIEKNINWLRLRDVTLNYTFSKATLKNIKFVKSLGVFFTGNDLILITNYTGADPAVSGNTAGTRGVGGWGFDYGNIATPISFNFGIKAAF
jgi:TonB-linked SusC/RagA family outer membrane protein